jgi:malate synthase
MTTYLAKGDLQIATELSDFLEKEVLAGTGIAADDLWTGYSRLLADLSPVNRALLAERDQLQAKIDEWHRDRAGVPLDAKAYRQFLETIGYIVPQGAPFEITTQGVDPEIARLAGPQLVVPVMNARFALNAANARWGSLYDALYGTDAIGSDGGLAAGRGLNEDRARAVIAWVSEFLGDALPLAAGQHADVVSYTVKGAELHAELADGSETAVVAPARFVGSAADGGRQILLLENNGLHIELHIDPASRVGKLSRAGLSDVVVEAALTTIQDCEDSVAAVDAADKVAVYRNWLGLMRGDLTASFEKGGTVVERHLAPDRTYVGVDGQQLTLPGRSVLLVRNVGHLMTTDAVLDREGNETPEGFLDALFTSACALHDLAKKDGARNSRTGSVYIVKPKMHGPAEVALANTLFDRVEDILGLSRNTLKIGVMDEERRTSINLRECIRAVSGRVVFINTGFLDRTGDEIHTSMLAGPVVPKNEIKNTLWLGAYEQNNVTEGLTAGFADRAQIGKGMWAKPDNMAEMLEAKLGHVRTGASTAWVPSPTAAVLHATHYHRVDVRKLREGIHRHVDRPIDELLTPPLLNGRNLSETEIRKELENNCQSILGYVVRWIDQGIGCSKVPDIDNVALMEDRATLRISSQHIANWLLHGITTEAEVMDTMRRMALVVDRQNEGDPQYRPMAGSFDTSVAFKAAVELVLEGMTQPNGYTEPILHRRRREAKARPA